MEMQRTIDEWRWWTLDDPSGRRCQSSHYMTEAEARARDRSAQPVRDSHRVRPMAKSLAQELTE